MGIIRPDHVVALLTALTLGSCCSCSDDDADQGREESSTIDASMDITGEALAKMSVDAIWELGVARFHWDSTGPPEDASKAEVIEWFLTDEEIKDMEDAVYIDRIRESRLLKKIGYRDGAE